MNIFIDNYANPSTVLKACDRPVNSAWQGQDRESHQNGDWGGVHSFLEAVDKAHEGFTEVTEEMKQTYDSSKKYVFERIKPRQVLPINSYVGSTPNVTRAILGLPKDMRKIKMEPRKAPGIDITYELGLNCGYSDDDLKERGARMLVLLSMFAMHGIPVKMSVSDSHTGLRQDRDEIAMYRYGIQDYGDTMNIRKVSYWLAHPSVHRRISFAITETSPIITRFSYGYGYPISNDEDECNFVKEYFKDNFNSVFLTPRDFLSDDDIIRIWNEITGGDSSGRCD